MKNPLRDRFVQRMMESAGVADFAFGEQDDAAEFMRGLIGHVTVFSLGANLVFQTVVRKRKWCMCRLDGTPACVDISFSFVRNPAPGSSQTKL